MSGPLTVEIVRGAVGEIAQARSSFPRVAEELSRLLQTKVLVAVAEGHPHGARLAAAAMKANEAVVPSELALKPAWMMPGAITWVDDPRPCTLLYRGPSPDGR